MSHPPVALMCAHHLCTSTWTRPAARRSKRRSRRFSFPVGKLPEVRYRATELLSSKNVVPEATVASGYEFRFPELEPALHDLLG